MNVNEQTKINVEITPQAPLNVTIGECAKMDCERALNYIKSGEAEIEKAVQEGIEDFNENAVSKTSDFDDNAVQKTNAFNQNAEQKQALIDEAAAEAKEWAIGSPEEPEEGSAKYWANQASSELSTLESDVSAIQAVIPAQASATNQLADKSFVNSSISTNTANFIGTFNSVAELEAYSGTLTNNDYAFVKTTDTAGNTLYDRYKWNGSEWLFEYELNNSSFTAAQWAAINSGATAEKLADYVTTNTAQTITSQKTFSSAIRRSSTIDQSATTGSKEVRFLDELDSENQTFAYWHGSRSTTINTASQRINNKNVSGANWASLNISANDAGQAWASINCGSGLSNRSVNEVTTSFSSTIIPTMGWVNNPNYSQNVFHRTGAETATGNKTFSGNVSFTGTATAVTQATSDSSTKLATTAFVNNAMSSYASLPSGVILPFGGSSAPTGFLICDGSAVSRTDYADLFDVIGTTYGSGDGSTTFNLPNLSSGVLPSSSTVDVVGNGNALGIVDDISTEAKQHNALVVGSGSSSFTSAKVPFSAFNLNAPLAIGSTGTALEFGTNNKALGVSTLPEWSGLTGSITGVSVNYIIKV